MYDRDHDVEITKDLTEKRRRKVNEKASIGEEWSTYLKYCKAPGCCYRSLSPYLFQALDERIRKKRQSKYLFRFIRRYFRLRYRTICYDSRPF